MELIKNKVAESGIITLDLAPFAPDKTHVIPFDIQSFLFRGLILREKDFRTALQTYEWQQYEGKIAAVYCSTDAIIPAWAYMLIGSYLAPLASQVAFGHPEEVYKQIHLQNISSLDAESFLDKRVILKGCGDITIPSAAYLAATIKLRPFAKSIMYGEPCSTVPVYKKAPNSTQHAK